MRKLSKTGTTAGRKRAYKAAPSRKRIGQIAPPTSAEMDWRKQLLQNLLAEGYNQQEAKELVDLAAS